LGISLFRQKKRPGQAILSLNSIYSKDIPRIPLEWQKNLFALGEWNWRGARHPVLLRSSRKKKPEEQRFIRHSYFRSFRFWMSDAVPSGVRRYLVIGRFNL